MKKQDIEKYRAMLEEKKEILSGSIENIHEQNLTSQREGAGELSGYSIHLADTGSDNYNREFALELVANEQEILYLIDDALERIGEGTYGKCIMCEAPIPAARLDAVPYAANCLKCQSRMERRRRM